MEESPQFCSNRNTRLSFRRRRQTDTPKTPLHGQSKSPDCFNLNNFSSTSSPLSTPLSRRKRTFFTEESPSQLDESYTAHFLLSQEPVSVDVDVGWKWEEGKKAERKVARPIFVTRLQSELMKITKPVRKSPGGNRKKGFYKFEEELMLTMNDSSVTKNENKTKSKICDENILTNTNNDNEDIKFNNSINYVSPSILTNKETNEVEEENVVQFMNNSITNLEGNMFEDSDFDNLLLQCSLQVETSNQQHVVEVDNKFTDKKLNDVMNCCTFENDSIDDLLLSLPDDSKCNAVIDTSRNSAKTTKSKKTPKTESVSPTNNDPKKDDLFDDERIDDLLLSLPEVDYSLLNTSSSKNKNSFSRHSTMPVSPITRNAVKIPSPLIRHNSLPMREVPIRNTKGNSKSSVRKR